MMNTAGKTQKLGVALIENVPPEVTDSQLVDYFNSMHDVESVQVLEGNSALNTKRNCWINLRNPLKVSQVREIAISGNRLHVRLMGYLLYPA